jgi:hypothetical protein
MEIDPGLLEYATLTQRKYIELLKGYDSFRAAERANGLSYDAISKSIRTLRLHAASRGYAPGHFDNGVAPGYRMGKVTVQRNGLGEVEHVWERQHPEAGKTLELLTAIVDGMRGEISPALPTTPPMTALAHLLTLYNFFDYHVGMLAWHREGGADWDLQIAERMGLGAMQMLVGGAPASDTGVVNIGGDFLHFDGLLPVTPTSGHVLDADSRFGKVVEVAIRLIRGLVSLALQKHRHVILLIMEGNHDLSSSLWLRKLFACLYENEPRVTVHESERPYYAIEWGINLIGFHHGHLKKNEQLPALFAALFREQWGRCPKVYIHSGHRHHKDEKDHTGARVTQHPTLAAMDAHASRHGYFTEREITAITYNKFTGQAASNTVTPEMLQDAG